MLDVLRQVERELPTMLKKEQEGDWNSVYVDYHEPFVERLWRPWKEYRIYLHRIFPCETSKALFHRHPWPSAMRVLEGKYEMGVGYTKGSEPPRVAAKLILPRFSEYEMTEPHAWHYVRPLAEASVSLMVTGTPWQVSAPKSSKKLGPLTWEQSQRIFKACRLVYR